MVDWRRTQGSVDHQEERTMSGLNAVLARNTDAAPQDPLSSQTVAFSHYNNLSAQLPIDPATGAVVAGGAAEQAKQCLANLKAVVESIGHVMDDVVRLTVFVTDIADVAAVDEAAGSFFSDYVPTRTNVAVAALPLGASVQIEALLSNGEGTIPDAPQAGDLVKVARNTDAAPTSPVSTQTVAFSHYNNLTAQLPIDPASGQLVAGGAAEQAAQCFANIKTILESIGHVMDDTVRITIFVTDPAATDAALQAYRAAFPGYVPALTTVAASALPMGAEVQVEAVVSHGDGTPPQPPEDAANIVIEASSTDAAPLGPFSQTVAFSHYNHISAQLPVDASGAPLTGGAKEQAAQCLTNIKAIVESVDHEMADAVKINIALTDLADLDAVDEAYATFFPSGVPARRVIGVSALPNGARVQIDAVFGNAEGTPPQG
jgi:reactive intermediate/imine deaminase